MRLIRSLFFLIILFPLFFSISFNNLYAHCYYTNYYSFYDIDCLNIRDIPIKTLNITDLYLKNIYETIEIERLLFAKKNGKNVLLGIKKSNLNSGSYNLNLFEYSASKKDFIYKGTYYKGFITDLEDDGNYEIVYSNPQNEEQLYIEKIDTLISIKLENNESLFFVQEKFIFTIKKIDSQNLTLNIYNLNSNSLRKVYEINLSSDQFANIERFFVYDNLIFAYYLGNWYQIDNNNISQWTISHFYQRDQLSFINQDDSRDSFYLNIPSYSFFKSFSFYQNKDPYYTVVKGYNWKGINKDFLFVMYKKTEAQELFLDIYELNNNSLIKTMNLSYFQAYRDKLFFSRGNILYYTEDFYNFYSLISLSDYFDPNNYDLEIERFYLFDLDNDNFDEIITKTNELILIFGNSEKKIVDYFIKEISFPEPYTTYQNHFNITVCGKGSQIIPFNLSIKVFHNTTKLKNEYFFENIFLHSNTCRTFKINYIPYKKGSLEIRSNIIVNDKDLNNNNLTIHKEVISDFYSLDIDFLSFNKIKEDSFLFIDENDDLIDGYEKLIINYSLIKQKLNLDLNISDFEVCKYLEVDYNNDNIKEYLFDCSFYDYYLLADPLNQILVNISYLYEEDFEFYVGVFNNSYTVILPWKNYSGYVNSLEKDENNLDIILVDYDLNGVSDFLIYPWALEKEVLDYKTIGKNLKLQNLFVSTYFDINKKKFIKEIHFDLLYKGLFDKEERIPLSIFGESFFISVKEDSNEQFFIPLSRTPYSDFNTIKISYNMENNPKNNKIKIDYQDYNLQDNQIIEDFCDLKILKVNLEPDNSYLEINKSCEEQVELEIYVNTSLIHSESTNETIIYLNNSLLHKEMKFVVYHKNKLEFSYQDNIKDVVFDLNKLITVDFLNTQFTLFLEDTLSFKISCKKSFNLNLELKCQNNNFNYKEEFYCEDEKEFSFDLLFENKDVCNLRLYKEEEQINLRFKVPLDFEIPKEIKRLKINDKEIIILEIDGEKKAYIREDKKLVDICEKKISKEEFEANIKLKNNCLNVLEVEVPDFLTVLEINTTGTSFKQGNKYFVYTFDEGVSFKTKSITKIDDSAKEKYNVIEENKERNKMDFLKKIAMFMSFGSFSLFIIVLLSYYAYIKYKKMLIEEKKMKIKELQRIRKLKEEEKKKKITEILKMKREKFIEEEARKLLTWLKFLLSTYDEKEIEKYLIKKGYNKEVVEKAFELYKKEIR